MTSAPARKSGASVADRERADHRAFGTRPALPGVTGSQLDPGYREAAWHRFERDRFDVVVIGGGVTGVGAALDAATRGLSVALVEARDWASGTSSRSSKLFHGGLRYLEQLEFELVREALRERERVMTRLAPHLVTPLPLLYPLTHRLWERPYVGFGLLLYDTIGGRSSLPRQKHLSRRAALRMFPGLRRETLAGAVRYFDTQVDDARYTLTVARTAARYGAVIRTSTQAVGFERESDRIVGVAVRDAEDGRETTIPAGVVLNCTGVWTDEVQAMCGERGRFKVRASKGVHVLVPRSRIVGDAGLIVRTPSSVLFVIPWKSHWLIGTTDTDWHLDLAHPAASKTDLDYLLGQVNAVLAVPLTHADIEGVYAGLRPLLAGESEDTSALSREHAVAHAAPGLVSIAGGKFTTYRVMAADAVDAGAEELRKRVPPSCTDRVPLLGADGYCAMANQIEELAHRYGLHPHRVRHLLGRYGSLVHDVLEPGLTDPTLRHAVPGAPDYLMAEIRYAVTHEGALHLEDVLTRRTRISVEYRHRGIESIHAVAHLVGDVLGWSPEQRAAEIVNYTNRVEAEHNSQDRLDDSAADAARCAAPDIRTLQPMPRLVPADRPSAVDAR